MASDTEQQPPADQEPTAGQEPRVGRMRKRRRTPPPTPQQAKRKGLAGPSTDPATNLLLTDVASRAAGSPPSLVETAFG